MATIMEFSPLTMGMNIKNKNEKKLIIFFEVKYANCPLFQHSWKERTCFPSFFGVLV